MNTRSLVLALALSVAAPAAVLAEDTPATAPVISTAATTKAPKAGDCAYRTGSRIRTTNKQACNGIGPQRVYTQRDLAMTGEINMSDALRKLDPIFR